MLGETEKSSDVCRTASLSEMGHEQRVATSSTVPNEPPRALAASTITWVKSQLHLFWAVVNKSNAG